ncbi:hypothetical protein HYH02_005063 [Chlamydomonas schloesseri]|uniref:F-box domain-containing protein n=1 Tax=Chlamydomonas schloesseri TaxID=2026947 RepID=A0A836B859_9CHLO|nr:hypothetical protein HYH02_005063 [Chlamydomonas schloesseri]|eukprot:KAG2450562.1 hypothetical protein HYH02_005063 [Chlamydomonas schloesseri]
MDSLEPAAVCLLLPEVVSRVYRFLDHTDLEAGLRVCRTWREALAPRVRALCWSVDAAGSFPPHTLRTLPACFSRVSSLCLVADSDSCAHRADRPPLHDEAALAAATASRGSQPLQWRSADVCKLLGCVQTLALVSGAGLGAAAAAVSSSGRPQHQQQLSADLGLLAFLSGLHHSCTQESELQKQHNQQQQQQQQQQQIQEQVQLLAPRDGPQWDDGAAGAGADARACPPLGSVQRLVLLGEAWRLGLPPLAVAAAAGLPKPLTSLAAGLGMYLPNLTHLDLAPVWELTPAGLTLADGDEEPAGRGPLQSQQGQHDRAGSGDGMSATEDLIVSTMDVLLSAGSRGRLAFGCAADAGGPGGAAGLSRSVGRSGGGGAGGGCPAVELAAVRSLAGLKQLRHLSARLNIGDTDRLAAWAGALTALPPALSCLRLLGPLCYCPDVADAVTGWGRGLPGLRLLQLELGECCHSHPDLESEMYGDPESWTSSCFAGVLPKLTQLRSLQLDVDDITPDLWRDALACCKGDSGSLHGAEAAARAAATAPAAVAGALGASAAGNGPGFAAGTAAGGLLALRLRQRGFSGACDGAGIADLSGLVDLCLTLGDGPNLSDLSALTRLTRLELQLLGLSDYVAAAAEAAEAAAPGPATAVTEGVGLGPAGCEEQAGGPPTGSHAVCTATAAASAATGETDTAVNDLDAALADLALAATASRAAEDGGPLPVVHTRGGAGPAAGQSGPAGPMAAAALPKAAGGLLPLITRSLGRLRQLHLSCRSATIALEGLGVIGRPSHCPRLRLLQLTAPLRCAAGTGAPGSPAGGAALQSGLGAGEQRQSGCGLCLPDELEWLDLVNTEAASSHVAAGPRPASSRSPHGGAVQRGAAPPLLRLAGLPQGLRHLQLAGIAVEVVEGAAHDNSSGAADAEEGGKKSGSAALAGLGPAGPGPKAAPEPLAGQRLRQRPCTATVSLVGCVVRCPLSRLWGSGLRVLDLTGSTLLSPEPCPTAGRQTAREACRGSGTTACPPAPPAAVVAGVADVSALTPPALPALVEALAACCDLRQLRLWGCCRGGGMLRPLGDAGLAALAAAHPRLTALEVNATAASPEGLAAMAALRRLRALRVLVAGQEGAAALGRALAAARALGPRAWPGPGPGPGLGVASDAAAQLESLEVVMASCGLAFVADCVREQLVAGLPGVVVQLRAQQTGD